MMVVHIGIMNFLLQTNLHSTTFESDNVELAEKRDNNEPNFKSKK